MKKILFWIFVTLSVICFFWGVYPLVKFQLTEGIQKASGAWILGALFAVFAGQTYTKKSEKNP